MNQYKQGVSDRYNGFLLAFRGEAPELPLEITVLLAGGCPGAFGEHATQPPMASIVDGGQQRAPFAFSWRSADLGNRQASLLISAFGRAP